MRRQLNVGTSCMLASIMISVRVQGREASLLKKEGIVLLRRATIFWLWCLLKK